MTNRTKIPTKTECSSCRKQTFVTFAVGDDSEYCRYCVGDVLADIVYEIDADCTGTFKVTFTQTEG